MSLKVFDYECDSCGIFEDIIAESGQVQHCSKCNKVMTKIFSVPKNHESTNRFSPFWSDTLQTRINDREDLKKLKQYRKDNNLECIGHTRTKPDRAAIKYNYEND